MRFSKSELLLFTISVFFFFFLALVSSDEPQYSCDSSNPQTQSLTFCKTSLPIRARVLDLVSRLTLDEKISQLVNGASSIPRLGIPAYEWWSEALHGVADVGRGIRLSGGTIKATTSFPQVILTAASFDSKLWYQIGQAIGIEGRALYNAGQASGLTFWSPNINIFRDPRWGRGQETPGEDPMVTGKYSVAFVRGVQGDSIDGYKRNRRHLQASACCKHFTAYDLENWNGMNRFIFDAKVTQQDMADTYQPPFQSCIEQGKASGLMCSYNRVNGVPTCADYNLISSTARQKWGFRGYVVSDCDAVSLLYQTQKYVNSSEDAVADVLKAGMDLNCGTYLQEHTKSAVEMRKVTELQINRAIRNLFAIRMRLGLFDGNPNNLPYGKIGPKQVCSQQHKDLALQAARQGIVLLKNSDKLLPFPKSSRFSLAVIGPNADSPTTLLGNYATGTPCVSVTPFQGLKSYVPNVVYHKGCNWVNCTEAWIDQAVEIAKGVDQVVLVMGLDQSEEKEDLDRVQLGLPGQQERLISEVAKAAKKPVVLVLLSGSPIDISSAKNDDKIGSILWAGYPGQAGGTAIAEIIFGDHNPEGRLPMTWYPRDYINVPMTDMRMRADPSSGYPGRTYRFYNGPKVFEYGYGLSYSNYLYEFTLVSQNELYVSDPLTTRPSENSDSVRYKLVSEMDKKLCESNTVTVNVGVKNEGEMRGNHSVLLFVRPGKAINGSPVKLLVGFERVELNGGEKGEVEFKINPCEHLRKANEEGLMIIEEGSHFLMVGDVEYPLHIFI